MNILSGWSTYIVIGALIILNVLHYLGINVPGFTSTEDVGNLIGVILAIWRARAGAKNDAAKALAAAVTSPSGVLAPASATTVADAKRVIASSPAA